MHYLITHVEEFHNAFGQPVQKFPMIPSDDRAALRIKLIKEEAREVKESFQERDIVNLAKELVDLLYVIDGCAIECGLQKYVSNGHSGIDQLNFMFRKVDQSPKFVEAADLYFERISAAQDEVINQIVEAFESKDVILLERKLGTLIQIVNDWVTAASLVEVMKDCHDEVHASNMSKLGADGKPVYREDGKVLKGPNYFPANLDKIIYGKINQIQTH